MSVVEEVEQYVTTLFGCADEATIAADQRAAEAGLPQIQITGVQGKWLCLLARLINARRILEIGTLGGFSTIWLARGLVDGGQVVTLELEPKHAEVARHNLQQAGVADRVEVLVGPATTTLAELAAGNAEPFDLVFIDADKPSYPQYLQWAVRLARPGALILADNVVREGNVVQPDAADAATLGADQFNRDLAEHPQLDAVIVPQLGSKGLDGIAFAVVRHDKDC